MKIAVVGAGITGFRLAAAMRSFDEPVEVELYERDPDAASRPRAKAWV